MKYHSIFERVRYASRQLSKVDTGTIDRLLNALADETEQQSAFILTENQKDLALTMNFTIQNLKTIKCQ